MICMYLDIKVSALQSLPSTLYMPLSLSLPTLTARRSTCVREAVILQHHVEGTIMHAG